MEMQGYPRYEAGFRYNYGAVDYYEGKVCMENTIAGLKPQKLAYNIESYLNQAVGKGMKWAKKIVQDCAMKEKTNDEILKCIYEGLK